MSGWLRPRFTRTSLARMLREIDPGVLRFQARVELRLALQRRMRDPVLPTALYLETSSYCPGACADCYVPAADRRRHLRLDRATLNRLLAAAERLPIAYVCVVGGEPLDASIVDENLRLVREHPRTRFLICTSGDSEIGPELGRALGGLRNLSLLVSFEGLPSTHQRIRPRGSFDRACAALAAYRRHSGSLAGASVTLRAENWREATSREFVERLVAAGAHYFVYSPCETRAGAEALEAGRHGLALARLAELSASSSALFFSHPFGQILGRRAAPIRRLRSLTVDYAGNVYVARRGPRFGNVAEADLASLLARPALQQAYVRAASGPAGWRPEPSPTRVVA
jgi:MoaA/NifB/PqqE/SkfB family radical SAM enzyme